MNNKQLANNLDQLKDEVLEKLEEMKQLLRQGPDHVRSRAEAYWLPHVLMAMTNEHSYLGGSMCTVDDTIEELREDDECE